MDKFAKQNGQFVKKPRHIMQPKDEPEVSDGSNDVFILIGYIAAFCVALYALAKAINLI